MTRAIAAGYSGPGAGLPRPRRRCAADSSAAAVPAGFDIEAEAPENARESEAPRVRPRSALWIASAAGAGYAPVAPGTVGSAAGVLVYAPLSHLGLPLYGVTLAGLLFLGIWAADVAERAYGQKDDGRIVIDEVVGQLITLTPLVAAPPHGDPRAPLWLLGGFLVFRLFDIWKPGPVRWAERRFEGGAGVVLDDAVAGLLGAGVLTAGWAVLP